MRVAIVGSKNIKLDNINEYIPIEMTTLITGRASGVEAMALEYAKSLGIESEIYEYDEEKFGDYAEIVRHTLLVQKADHIVAIWNGISRGTRFIIDYARELNKSLKIILIDVIGVQLIPSSKGKDCFGNGMKENNKGEKHFCCEECEFAPCCSDDDFPNNCSTCKKYCPSAGTRC